MKSFSKKQSHTLFIYSLILKGIHALLEIIGGISIFWINKTFLMNIVFRLTQEELSEDPKDIFAHYLIKAAQNFSITAEHFASFYLLVHGVIKLFLIIGLFKQKKWAYPVSIGIFCLFIIYQLIRFMYTHSMWLIIFTIFDVLVVWLTWKEYSYIKTKRHF